MMKEIRMTGDEFTKMMKMKNNWKVLNLYAGIGGNRKLWKNVKVIAVEWDKKIAAIYQDFFPNDEVLVVDAHATLPGLMENGKFDFIWSSPPCPSHSIIRKNSAVARGQNKPIYPDMKLYEEIIFLKGHFKGKWVVENVKSWYNPLIKPYELGGHYFWSNFPLVDIKNNRNREHDSKVEVLQDRKGFDLSKYNNLGIEKKLLLRNCVEPELGLHILNMARSDKQQKLTTK